MPSRRSRLDSEGEDELSDDTPSPPVQRVSLFDKQKRPLVETLAESEMASMPNGESTPLKILHYKPETREFTRNKNVSLPEASEATATATEPLLPPLRRARTARQPPVKRFREIRPRPPQQPTKTKTDKPNKTPAARSPPVTSGPRLPIVRQLRTGMPVPWSELSFWVPGWLDKSLQSLLCRRITKTGARLAYTMEEAHVVLINPHGRYRPHYEPLHNLPSVLAGKALLEPYSWFLKCYYRGAVAEESTTSPVFVDESQEALRVAVGAMRNEEDRLSLMIKLEENGAVIMPEQEADVIVLDWAHPFLREQPNEGRWAEKEWRSPAWVKDAIRYNTTDLEEQAIAREKDIKVERGEPEAGPSGTQWDADEESEDDEDDEDEDDMSGSDEDDESEPAEESDCRVVQSSAQAGLNMADSRSGSPRRPAGVDGTRGQP